MAENPPDESTDQKVTIELIWDGITVVVTHTPDWICFNDTKIDHIEVKADVKLPVTETGYRSHYVSKDLLGNYDSPEAFVRDWLDDAATSKKWQKHVEDSRQLTLF